MTMVLACASMLFSTSSAMALSGLLCESAMMRMAFQSSPIRNLPLSNSFDLAAAVFATLTRNSTHLFYEPKDLLSPPSANHYNKGQAQQGGCLMIQPLSGGDFLERLLSLIVRGAFHIEVALILNFRPTRGRSPAAGADAIGNRWAEERVEENPRPVSKRPGRGIPVWGLGCFRSLGTHLFHELAHGCDVARRSSFRPFLIALRSFFQVRAERLGNETLSECWSNRLDQLPDTEKLSAGFEEQVLM